MSPTCWSIGFPVNVPPPFFPLRFPSPLLQLELQNVADRVNLGLIPTSEEGWPIACRVLRKDIGGILHIHQNVESFPVKAVQLPQGERHPLLPSQVLPHGQGDQLVEDCNSLQEAGTNSPSQVLRSEWQRWAEVTANRIRTLLQELDGKQWRTNILHIERVKSYAPHVHHLVLDLDCRPVS